MIVILLLGAVAIGYVSAKTLESPLCYVVAFIGGSAWGVLVSAIANA